MSADDRTRDQSIAELEKLVSATRLLHDELVQLQFRVETQLRYLRSKAHTPASHRRFQEQLADDIRDIDGLVNDWTVATKPALDAAPMKSEPITPGGL